MMDLPHAQISTGFPYASFLSTSGERYPGVPAKPVKTTVMNT